MSYQDHLKICGYCRDDLRTKKLAELGHMIRGTSYAGTRPGTKGASVVEKNSTKPKVTIRLHSILSEKQKKLKELGKIIKGE